MIDRRTRQVGVQLIERALAKLADAHTALSAPVLQPLPQKQETAESMTAKAVLPKVLSAPA